jgi:hypothetical protein
MIKMVDGVPTARRISKFAEALPAHCCSQSASGKRTPRKTMPSQRFPIWDVLQIATRLPGDLMSCAVWELNANDKPSESQLCEGTEHLRGAFEVLDFMTGTTLTAEQVVKVAQECCFAILNQYPGLAYVGAVPSVRIEWTELVENKAKELGGYLEIAPLAQDRVSALLPQRRR